MYQKRCPSVHSSSSFLLEPQFCSWNYTSIYGAPQLSNPIQSHAWLLASLISQKLACSLFSHLLPTYSFSATQSSMPSDHTTATRTVWFEEEKTFFNFCTVSTRRLLLHTSNPSPSLHQFTNYLKNPVGSSSITFVCCIMLGRILFFIKKGLANLNSVRNILLHQCNCHLCSGWNSNSLMARIICSWQCCGLLFGNIANGIASKKSLLKIA